MEESNAYSETFEEEESLGASAQLPAKDLKDPKSASKMAPVEEESIDESIVEQSKNSAAESSARRESAGAPSQSEDQQSLPSEDQEIQNTARSVEWQIEIAQDSERADKSKDKKENIVTETDEGYTDDDFIQDEEIEDEVDELED